MLNIIHLNESDLQYIHINDVNIPEQLKQDDKKEIAYVSPELSEMEYVPVHLHIINDDKTPPEFSNCKIITGNTRYTRNCYEKSVKQYIKQFSSNLSEKAFLTPLSLTTLTIYGKISNVLFHEEEIIDMLNLTHADNRILKIECNYGEYYHPCPLITLIEKKRSTKKIKRGHKRRYQGSGLYFGSQITFYIYNDDYKKTYIIKLFRRGEIQVSGIRTPNMIDVLKPLILLRNYLRHEFQDQSIELIEIKPVMRNYTSRMVNTDLRFDLNVVEECIMKEKEINGAIGISTIQYNTERYFAVVVKFDRPIPWKAEKKCAIKILKSGKINFDGSNSSLECLELYCWFYTFCQKYREKIIYNYISPTITISNNHNISNSDAENADGYESIYDDSDN